ncbi:MAG: hypothetical protein AB1921_01210, partial [Thermodesulfobacteriota bacterium]
WLAAVCLGWGLPLSPASAASPPAGTSIVNRAVASCADANGNPLPEVSASVATVVSGGPALVIEKLASSDPAAMGALLTYTISYRNTGNAPATNVTVQDFLSRHLEFVSADGNGVYAPGPPDGGTVSWSLGGLDAGATGVLTLTARVKTPADYPPGDCCPVAAGTVISNTVRIASDTGAAERTIQTTVGQASNLEIGKAASVATVMPGGIITYTLSYRNTGNLAATNIRITDPVPAGTAYAAGSATAGGTLSGGSVIWDFASLAAGAQGSVSFSVTVSPLAVEGESIRNICSILSTEKAAAISNEVLTTVAATPTLALQKTVDPGTSLVGAEVIFTITAANTGTVMAANASVSDTLPPLTSFVSADAGGVFANGRVTWSLGDLLPGESRTLSLTIKTTGLPAGGLLGNTAQVTADGMQAVSATAVKQLACGSQSTIAFTDQAGGPVTFYTLGQDACVRVTDADRNTDPAVIESILVTLTEPQTGDTETLTLTETDPVSGNPAPDTGVFSACITTDSKAAVPGDGMLSVAPNSAVNASYDNPDAALCGNIPLIFASVLIDPFGVVFDSISGAPVSGAVVTLFTSTGARAGTLPNWPAGQPDQVTTAADGAFAFLQAPPGDYYYAVSAGPDHSFPSGIPDASLPPGFAIGPASRGQVFTLSAGMPPLNLDIPVDPMAGALLATKTCNTQNAAIGDVVAYEISLQNTGSSPVTGLALTDWMPHGISPVPGTVKLQGRRFADPKKGATSLTWALPDLAPGSSFSIVFRAVLGPDSARGDGKNTAIALGTSLGRSIASNIATHTLTITEGVFTSKGVIIGKVFLDKNGDGLQTGPGKGEEPDEPGIEGVSLYLEDGTRVVTDESGKFSIPAVANGTHVLRIDKATLPPCLAPEPASNRFMGSSSSQFVDMAEGVIFKANFPVKTVPHCDAPSAPASAPSADILPAAAQEQQPAEELEKRIETMTPDLGILSPAEGQAVQKGCVNLAVKAPAGSVMEIAVNGKPAGENRAGKTVTNRKTGVTVVEYIGVPLDGEGRNLITVKMKDSFGNPRGEASVSVIQVGKARKAELGADRDEAPADERSAIGFSARVLDRDGNALPQAGMATVETSCGNLLGKDADETAPGFQVPYTDGAARFAVQAPASSCKARVTVMCEGLSAETEVFFAPHLRDMMVVGVGEVVLGKGDTKGDYSYIKQDRSFDDGTYVDGRGAVFLKGRVLDDYLLTMAFDSHKEEQKGEDKLFRENDKNLDTEDKYPTYGDESTLTYEAESREKLFAKIEKDKSYAVYGDFRTELDDTDLAAYNRSFTGGLVNLETGKVELRAFGSRTAQDQVIDEIRGKGISGYYFLDYGQVVEGSERITIEVRDRYQADRVLSRELKERGVDYEVDYDIGAILFKAPVPAFDQFFNPVFIVVNYETESDQAKHYVYGGRAAVTPLSWVTLGATGVREEKDAGNVDLSGADLTFRLPMATEFKAEYAKTDNLFTEDTGFVPKSGEAYLLRLKSEPLSGLHLAGAYVWVDDYFQNLSATDATPGTERYSLEAGYDVNDATRLTGRYLYEKDRLNNMENEYASAGVSHKLSDRFTLGADLLYENSTAQFLPQGAENSRYPFDWAEEKVEDATSARVSADFKATKKLSLLASHQQELTSDNYRITSAGVGYSFTDDTRTYVKEEYGKYMEREETRTILGSESKLTKNTVAYSEYRVADAGSGTRNQQVLGLRNKIPIAEGITGNLNVEHQATVRGEEKEGEPDAFAIAGGLEVLRSKNFKLTSRLEYRDETSDNPRQSYLGEVGVVARLKPGVSLLLRERLFFDDMHEEGTLAVNRAMVGLAYRPVAFDRLNLLSKFEYKYDRDTVSDPALTTNSYIPSVEGVYQANRRLSLAAKYAGKLTTFDDRDSYTDLVAGRILLDLTDRFDIGLCARMLTSYEVNSRYYGGYAEAGYRVVDDLWLSAGYAFDDFDPDLTGDGYHGIGPYLKLRFKFDEETFRTRQKIEPVSFGSIQ